MLQQESSIIVGSHLSGFCENTPTIFLWFLSHHHLEKHLYNSTRYMTAKRRWWPLETHLHLLSFLEHLDGFLFFYCGTRRVPKANSLSLIAIIPMEMGSIIRYDYPRDGNVLVFVMVLLCSASKRMSPLCVCVCVCVSLHFTPLGILSSGEAGVRPQEEDSLRRRTVRLSPGRPSRRGGFTHSPRVCKARLFHYPVCGRYHHLLPGPRKPLRTCAGAACAAGAIRSTLERVLPFW